jgi:hypothetical protein
MTVIKTINDDVLKEVENDSELGHAVQLTLLCDFLQDILITEAAVAENEALDHNIIEQVAQRR